MEAGAGATGRQGPSGPPPRPAHHDAVAALYAADATFDDPPEHRSDRKGVHETYAEVLGYWEVTVDPVVGIVGDEGAVVSWTYTWCGGILKPCPSAAIRKAVGTSVLRMTGGVITSETLYYLAGGEPSDGSRRPSPHRRPGPAGPVTAPRPIHGSPSRF